MVDVDLYSHNTGSYNQVQNSRPDYVQAIDRVVEVAKQYLFGTSIVADFCCGTGSVIKKVAEEVGGIHKAILIDVNEEFLTLAKNSNIKAEQLETKQGDILAVELPQEADVVLSVFAYHHVPDQDKDAYIKQIKRVLKPEGVLILGEIYSPDQEATISYYDELFRSVPIDLQTPTLKKFLEETARSE